MGKLILGMLLIAFVLLLGKQLVHRYRKRRDLEDAMERLHHVEMDERVLSVDEQSASMSKLVLARRQALKESNSTITTKEGEESS